MIQATALRSVRSLGRALVVGAGWTALSHLLSHMMDGDWVPRFGDLLLVPWWGALALLFEDPVVGSMTILVSATVVALVVASFDRTTGATQTTPRRWVSRIIAFVVLVFGLQCVFAVGIMCINVSRVRSLCHKKAWRSSYPCNSGDWVWRMDPEIRRQMLDCADVGPSNCPHAWVRGVDVEGSARATRVPR